MDLNQLRRMAGVKEVYVGNNAQYSTQLTESEDFSLANNANELEGKSGQRFVLVHDPLSDQSTPGDMIVVLDGPSFANVFIGAHTGTNDAKVAAKEGWTLYHYNQMNRALADVNSRLKKAGIDTVVTEGMVVENCGQPHMPEDEEESTEEESTEQEDRENNPDFAKCPKCEKMVGRDEYFDHAKDHENDETEEDDMCQAPEQDSEEDSEEDEEYIDIRMEGKIDDEVKRLKSDKRYIHDLISDMLSSEGKENTPSNRKDAAKRADGKYLRDIAKENLGESIMEAKKDKKKPAKKKTAKKKAPTKAKAEDATIDYSPTDKDESPNNEVDDGGKIHVPAEVKSAFKTEIKQLRKEADNNKIRDEASAELYTNTANAFEEIAKCLDMGTMEEYKRAQVFMAKLMGPIKQRIPDIAYKFLVGSNTAGMSLKDLFTKVKNKKK